jgi:hypothetical protein
LDRPYGELCAPCLERIGGVSDPNGEIALSEVVNPVRLADLDILHTGGCGLIPELGLGERTGRNEGAQ